MEIKLGAYKFKLFPMLWSCVYSIVREAIKVTLQNICYDVSSIQKLLLIFISIAKTNLFYEIYADFGEIEEFSTRDYYLQLLKIIKLFYE